MAMRLYHRRSSASRDKILPQNGLAPHLVARLQVLGACGRRHSDTISRPRSLSLTVPPRSRSQSFSGATEDRCHLTESEEEHIFQCYTRVMYTVLGVVIAFAIGILFYGLCTFVT